MSRNVDYSLALTELDIADVNDAIFNDVRFFSFLVYY